MFARDARLLYVVVDRSRATRPGSVRQARPRSRSRRRIGGDACSTASEATASRWPARRQATSSRASSHATIARACGRAADHCGLPVGATRKKFTVTTITTGRGSPLSSVGVYSHCRTASSAAWSSSGIDRRMRAAVTLPSAERLASIITTPCTRA
ncbi:MAG: hypothetical protein MZV63_16740 [Marinilabiliales bacterium]|nr:hypothetical protein [Marinilabiliales bacterium]